MIPPEKLKLWRELAEKATPGPWELVESDDDVLRVVQTYGKHGIRRHICEMCIEAGLSDPEFITASREAVPALIEEVERQEQEIHTLRALVQNQRKALDTPDYAEYRHCIKEELKLREEIERLKRMLNFAENGDLVMYKRESEYYFKQLEELGREVERLREALRDLFALMDEGFLVRDISRDAEPDWALKMIPFVQRLQKAKAALGEPKCQE